MKILFFSDLHGDMNTLNVLKKKSEEVDMVVCAGDMSTMESNLPAIIAKMGSFPKQVLLVHGNHEDPDNLKEMCMRYDNLIFLHKGVHHVDDYVFMGYGGDGFSTTDEDFTRIAKKFFKKEAEGKRRIVMVTHGPPYKTALDLIGSEHRGNKSYKEFIDEIKPHLVISGHLHENAGKHDKVGRTFYLNPGKKGAVVEL